MMDDGTLFELAREGSPSVAGWNLVDRALENGGTDNVTDLQLDVLAVEPWTDEATGGHRREAVALAEEATGRRESAETAAEGESVSSPALAPSTPGPLDRLKGLFSR
jgi:hypothetical protein